MSRSRRLEPSAAAGGSVPALLRRVRTDDSELLRAWRNLPRVRAASISDAVVGESEHAEWFSANFAQLEERMVMVVWHGRPVGWYRVETWDESRRHATWSFVLGEQAPGVGAMLPILGLADIFERRGAASASGVVLDTNRNVLSMFRRLGIPEVGPGEPVQREDGTVVGVTAFLVRAEDWAGVRGAGLAMLAGSVGSMLEELMRRPIDGSLALRPADASDSPALLAWRNDREAREASISVDPITQQEHGAWFEGILHDADRHLYIAELDGHRIGMCRFDVTDAGAEVSINLNPDYRGRGLARPVLAAAIDRFRAEVSANTVLVARIRPSNPASIRIFGELGFRRTSSDGDFERYTTAP